jgi:H+-transporting ATPase
MQTNLEVGLKSAEVNERQRVFGYNEVPERKEKFWLILGKRFWGIVPGMLEVTVILTLLLGKYMEASVIIALLIFNAGMSQWVRAKQKKQ